MPAHRRTDPPATTRRFRRGSVYVLALGASTLVVIAGLSVVAITRAQGRIADTERDSAEASFAARSGIEIVAAGVNANTSWRTTYRNLAAIGPITIGRASVTAYLVDETDADLANDATQPVRVTAVARVGGSTRALSARLVAAGNLGLDCLRSSAISDGSLTVSGGTVSAGTLMSNTSVNNSATLTADVEAPSVSSSGFINGRVTTGSATAKSMPSAAIATTLSSAATALPYASLNERLDGVLLSPASNPYGTANARGIYAITVPSGRTLTIRRSRLQATLLIALGSGATLQITESVNWEPGQPDLPALIVTGTSSANVLITPSSSALSESEVLVNFNPPGTPYNGTSNATLTDSYPSGIRGIIHVPARNVAVTVTGSARLTGTLLVAGSLSITGTPTMAPIASYLTSPPMGYTRTSDITMQVEPGSYQWVVDAATR